MAAVAKARHSNKLPIHQESTLSRSYFDVQTESDSPPFQLLDRSTGVPLTPEQIAARSKKLAAVYDKAMEERVEGGEHTGEI